MDGVCDVELIIVFLVMLFLSCWAGVPRGIWMGLVKQQMCDFLDVDVIRTVMFIDIEIVIVDVVLVVDVIGSCPLMQCVLICGCRRINEWAPLANCRNREQKRTNQAGADAWLSGTNCTMQHSPRTAHAEGESEVM